MALRLSVDLRKIDGRNLSKPGGPMDQALLRAGGIVRDEAKAALTVAGRVDTGNLRNSIRVSDVAGSPHRRSVSVGSDLLYAKWQHEGVQGPIYPRRAKVLRFKPKGSSGFVFARKVRGFEGVPFLQIGLDRLRSRGLR